MQMHRMLFDVIRIFHHAGCIQWNCFPGDRIAENRITTPAAADDPQNAPFAVARVQLMLSISADEDQK